MKSRPRFISKLKPVPTIMVGEESEVVPNMKHPVSVPRKSPSKRVYQADQYEDFLVGDRIESLNDIDDKVTPIGFNMVNSTNISFSFKTIERPIYSRRDIVY